MSKRHPILLVEDDATLREALAETLRLADYEVVTAADGETALVALTADVFEAVVTDYQMKPMDGFALLSAIRELRPSLPVLMITAHGSIEHAVRCMLEGATDYLVKPFAAPLLIERLKRLRPLMTHSAHDLVVADPLSVELVGLAERVAASDVTVLISGESGTGKEVLARLLHQLAPRADRPFVAINCAAIPENMLEALLFGHEKGAFTGAHEARPGKFEQAQGGTLLLDEISEMDIGLQAKLLRVLQEREVERIGGRTPIPLDVRVIATTNRDLRQHVAAGKFREDLYYRLSVIQHEVPPLRARRDDIPALADHFLARVRFQTGRKVTGFSAEAMRALLAHPWPGNCRELKNAVERAVVLGEGELVRLSDLPPQVVQAAPGPPPTAPSAFAPMPPLPPRLGGATPTLPPVGASSLRDLEKQGIMAALAATEGNKAKAAAILEIDRSTLYKKLKEYGIET